jgi:hypothetical protein
LGDRERKVTNFNNNKKKETNHLGGGLVVKLGTKRFAFSVISGSSPVVAHMMATGGLHGR